MTRAHFVKAARKAVPQHDIKIGDSYYWWKFRRGGKHYSKTSPRRSQLTRSDYLGQLYDLEDEIADLVADSSLQDRIGEIASAFRELGEECEERRSNMPYQLQDSDSGTLLQERADACFSVANDLEAIDADKFEEDEDETDGPDGDGEARNADGLTEEEYWQAVLDEVIAVDTSACDQ